MTKLITSGYWSTFHVARNSGGKPMCLMRASWKDGSTLGEVFVKWNNGSLFIHISKSNWRFGANVEIPLSVTFDRGTRNGTGTSFHSADGASMIEIGVKDDAVYSMLVDFAESDKMVISFKSGDEPDWVANMYGSRNAAASFIRCIKYIRGDSDQQSGTSPVPRQQPTSPVGPQATSPVPSMPKSVPTQPVAPNRTAKGDRKRDDGSI